MRLNIPKRTMLYITNINKNLCLAISLILLCCSCFAAGSAKEPNEESKAGEKISEYMVKYYKHPQPDSLPWFINSLMDSKQFSTTRLDFQLGIYTAFITVVAKNNPEKIETWMKQLKLMNDREYKTIYRAIWNANTKQSKQYLEVMVKSSNLKAAKIAAEVITVPPEDILNKKITADTLDQLWASYEASGDNIYLMKIIEFINQDDYFLIMGAEIYNRKRLHDLMGTIDHKTAISYDDLIDSLKKKYPQNYQEKFLHAAAVGAAIWSMDSNREQDQTIDEKVEKFISKNPKSDYRAKIKKAWNIK